MSDRNKKTRFSLREYRAGDAVQAGKLIADTYAEFNLAFLPPERKEAFLGPFQHAYSQDESKQAQIAAVIRARIVLVAEKDGEIVGILRGRKDKLQSLFVRADCHRQGVGRGLVAMFEQECRSRGSDVIRLMSTLYAVAFYQALGYKKSTGVRRMHSFEGQGLPYQPMKKVLTGA